MSLRTLAALAMIVGACHREDPYTSDLETMCRAEAAANVRATTPDGATRVARYIASHLRSPQGRALFQSFAVMPPDTRPGMLSGEARAHGIQQCPLAVSWATTRPQVR